MKWLTFVMILFLLVSCGGIRRVSTSVHVHIPELENPEQFDDYYQQAWKNLKLKKPRLALDGFKQSTAPDEPLYAGFGFAYLSQDKLAMARKNFQKVLDLNPDSYLAQLGMAELHEMQGEKQKAFMAYSRLLTHFPEEAWAKVRYEYIKSTETQYYLSMAEQHKSNGKNDKYVESLQRAAWYSREILDIKIKIADFYHNQQQYDQAAPYYEEILTKEPNNEAILIKMADVYEKLNKLDSALLVYTKLRELKPGDLMIINKVNELKIKFYNLDLPNSFKNIFFKDVINREELAALLGFYFKNYLKDAPPRIITDIGSSFAKDYIIKICSLDIMKLGANHRFNRFANVTRAEFAVIFAEMLNYLEAQGAKIQYTPLAETIEPLDISPLHKNYKTIKMLINTQIMKLDKENKFNPTQFPAPTEILNAIKKILISMKEGQLAETAKEIG
jgi:Tfp pilus assembly protein PilF